MGELRRPPDRALVVARERPGRVCLPKQDHLHDKTPELVLLKQVKLAVHSNVEGELAHRRLPLADCTR